MEERYQGYRDVIMLADYCWCLKRDLLNSTHKIFEATLVIILIAAMYLLWKYHHALDNHFCVRLFLKTAFIALIEIGES